MADVDLKAVASVRVALSDRAYEIVIGRGVLDRLGALARDRGGAGAARAFLVVDDKLPGGLVERAAASLSAAGFKVTRASVTATETGKSLKTTETLLMKIAETRHERGEPVVALGGGIVGDVAGFAAGIYRRGVPVIQCPTTLLSMVDASVGGKTGANLAVGDTSGSGSGKAALKKNLIGVFHQPVGVLADLAALDSLPDRELRAGLAECVKHAMISADFDDAGLWTWMDTNAAGLVARQADLLLELVARNVRIKARVVAGDEREEASDEVGGRALLNLGHTFGHAIEPLAALSPDGDPKHAPLLHGEAVALGLVAASTTAERLALCPAGTPQNVGVLLRKLGLPAHVTGLPDDATIMAAMAHDKKVTGGRMRLVLPHGEPVGRAKVVANPDEAAVRAGLNAIRGTV